VSSDLGTILTALGTVLEPFNLLIIFGGVAGGIIVGIIPGLGSPMAIAILLPFTLYLDPAVAISLVVAIWVGSISGGCVSAILIRMPGTPSSIATLLDGYPMAQKGLAGNALGNAVTASFFGAILSGVFLVLMAPLLAEFAVQFYFAEYTAVTIFALTAVAAVSGNSLSRGLFSVVVGLLAATFGLSDEDGLSRFDFGIEPMKNGFRLIPVLIGLFAISQIMHNCAGGSSAPHVVRTKLDKIMPTLTDIKRNIVNYIRSGLIGTFIGILPGLGGGPAGIISYAQARNFSKNPSKFGTGVVEGVIAAETANNATIGGALIITLALGIPGDPVMAILIGALMVHGLAPGPLLFEARPDVIYGIYFTVFVGSLMIMIILLLSMRWLARVTEVPNWILIPPVLILATTGVYSLNNSTYDIIVMFGFGVVGYMFDRFNIPLAPLILGLVLGSLLEENFRKLLGSGGSASLLFTSPIPLTFMVLSFAFIGFSLWRQRLIGTNGMEHES